MSTLEDIQFVADEWNTAATEQEQRARIMADLVKSLPGSHGVTFSSGEQISTNLMHAHAEQIDQQIARVAVRVVRVE